MSAYVKQVHSWNICMSCYATLPSVLVELVIVMAVVNLTAISTIAWQLLVARRMSWRLCIQSKLILFCLYYVVWLWNNGPWLVLTTTHRFNVVWNNSFRRILLHVLMLPCQCVFFLVLLFPAWYLRRFPSPYKFLVSAWRDQRTWVSWILWTPVGFFQYLPFPTPICNLLVCMWAHDTLNICLARFISKALTCAVFRPALFSPSLTNKVYVATGHTKGCERLWLWGLDYISPCVALPAGHLTRAQAKVSGKSPPL